MKDYNLKTTTWKEAHNYEQFSPLFFDEKDDNFINESIKDYTNVINNLVFGENSRNEIPNFYLLQQSKNNSTVINLMVLKKDVDLFISEDIAYWKSKSLEFLRYESKRPYPDFGALNTKNYRLYDYLNIDNLLKHGGRQC